VTSLADARTGIYDALDATQAANTYRRRILNPQSPAFVVGWPQTMDVSAAMGSGIRDYVIDVHIGIEVLDEEGADEELEDLIEVAVTAILEVPQWGVQPVDEFGEAQTQDGRTFIWCRLPVTVL
jgi:hypothetical protein